MKLFNTLTRSKDEFVPMVDGHVKMYACGPTVYNYFHLGNARPFVTFDTLRRYLEYIGYEVEFCQNFTDIDDKMIKRANEEGVTVKDIAERYIKEYYIDADGLNCKRPTYQPRATESIGAIIGIVKSLYDQGIAYVIEGDGVYYDVTKKEDYGKLSHYNLEDLNPGGGERKASYDGKKNPSSSTARSTVLRSPLSFSPPFATNAEISASVGCRRVDSIRATAAGSAAAAAVP